MTYETRKDAKGNIETKDIEGQWRNAKRYHESLESFPSHAQKFMGTDGQPALVNVVTSPTPCGCKVVGCGTIQFPITIDFCSSHQSAEAVNV